MRKRQTGFTLVELLVSILVTGIMMGAIVSAFSAQNKFSVQQDRVTTLEENLRNSLHLISDTLRSGGYGVPKTNLGSWIGTGWTTLPVLLSDSNATLNVASCTAPAVTTLGPAGAAAAATTLTVASNANLTVGRTIWINSSEFAQVISKSGTTNITIDTNPLTSGNQPLSRAYGANAPICQIDVTSFSLNASGKTLGLLRNGTSIGTLAENISAMQVVTQVAGTRYQITLTGTTTDPKTGDTITRSLSTDITLANRL